MNHPTVLVFPDRRERGTFAVRDGAGRELARIATSWTGASFTASAADGRPLCAAATNWFGLSGRWRASGPDGGPLLQVRAGALSGKATVRLERGETFTMRGSAWRRNFTVTDAADQTVLAAVPRTPALSFHPHDYAVSQLRPVFALPELVALVQIWRLVRKAEANAAAGSVAATTATFSG